jgi:hypothetical protein
VKHRKTMISIQYSAKSAQELLGRQSVRTTFKLSERSIEALSILAGQLGIKQKSLFDHLIDDIPALQVIAADYDQEAPPQRVAKTYVISRRTLDNLERVSTRYQTPRDALVELSIERIIPLLFQEKEKHEKRKVILKKMYSMLEAGDDILALAKSSLGEDDPVYRKIDNMMKVVNSSCSDIETCVERGRKIEEF